MAQTASEITEKVQAFIMDSFSDVYEIYKISYKPTERKMVLEVMIDSPEGIKIEDCVKVSRALSEHLDEIDFMQKAYTLEVSSPGVERILKRLVDYERHVGKLVKWTMNPDEKGKKEVFNARLREFSEEKIVVSKDKGTREFKLTDVFRAKAVMEFPPKLKRG